MVIMELLYLTGLHYLLYKEMEEKLLHLYYHMIYIDLRCQWNGCWAGEEERAAVHGGVAGVGAGSVQL